MEMAKGRQYSSNVPPEVQTFISDQYGDASYDGYVILMYREKNGTYQPMKVLRISDLPGFVEKEMHISNALDYTISANAFKSPLTRCEDNLFALINIVIDIDCHSIDESSGVEDKCQDLERILIADIFLNDIIPMPNCCIFTGRGMQFWWSLQPTYVKPGNDSRILPMYTNLIRKWSGILRYELSQMDEFRSFSVDEGASVNKAGVFRFPGTRNQTAGKQTVIHRYGGYHYELYELIDKNYVIPGETGTNQRSLLESPKVINVRSPIPAIAFAPWEIKLLFLLKEHYAAYQRISALIALRTIRNAPLGGENRDIFCFIFYNTLRFGGLCDADALSYTLQFNQGFKAPLNDRELTGCLSSSRKTPYKFKNATIISKLDITPEEQSKIKLSAEKNNIPSNTIRNQTRKEAKVMQIACAIALYKSGEKKKIKEKLNMSTPTINKYIEQYESGRLEGVIQSAIEVYDHSIRDADGKILEHI